MDNKVVFCIARDLKMADDIITQLTNAGFSRDSISFLSADRRAKDTKGNLGVEKNTKAAEGATIGGTSGGLIGGALGLLAGLGALAIPGAGPFIAAGPIMGTLAGIGAGGSLGAIAGALVGLGIPEYEAKHFEDVLRNNPENVLVSVHTNTSEEINRIKDIFEKCGAQDVSTTSEAAGPSRRRK